MKINGRAIAMEIYEGLKLRSAQLKKQGVIPHIAVILVGADSSSKAFVNQKKEWSKYIGAEFSLINYPDDISNEELLRSVKYLNNDPDVHGIIIQRPLPSHIHKDELIKAIRREKDIDGFRHDSTYTVPVAGAVMLILEKICKYALLSQGLPVAEVENFRLTEWLKTQTIVIIGKGETAGNPIISHLNKFGIEPKVITSTTKNPQLIIKNADIVISAVGKGSIISKEMLKQGVILLGVGIHKEKDGLVHGDYSVNDIKDKASFYTASTGGIGPVNVACLLSNLISAAEGKDH